MLFLPPYLKEWNPGNNGFKWHLVPCVQIKVQILHCVKDTVRPWQAVVCFIVRFLPPPRLQCWSSLNRLKCYRGSHHKIQPACLVNIISANVRNHRAQETYVSSDSNKSSVSVKYQSKLSMHASVHSLYAPSIMSCYMLSKTERLELVPCQSPPKLNRGKERCQWVERRSPRKWYCKCKITQCEKCKSTVGNWAITAEDYVP